MYHYKISAENIRRVDINEIRQAMETLPGVQVIATGQDQLFEGHAIWIVCSEQQLEYRLQDMVWRYNDGAWCNQTEIDEELVDSYC